MSEKVREGMDVTEMQVVRALERRPQAPVPEGFATRVVQALPARAHSPVRRPGAVGRTTTLAAAALLAGTLFVLAPHAGPSFSNWAFDAEMFVLVELAAVAWLLARFQGA